MDEKMQQTLEHLELERAKMHQWLDTRYDMLKAEIIRVNGDPAQIHVGYQLNSSVLKGKRPVALRLPDGQEIPVKTWKQLVVNVMQACNRDANMHNQLTMLCGKIFGKNRIILDRSPKLMDVPLKIDEEIYMEGKYDTNSLLYVLTERILNPIGYDYSKIVVYC